MKLKLHKFSNFNFKIFALILLVCNILYAQTSKLQIIGKPEKSTSEIVAVRDANGRFCAGIKVISNLEGFSYDSYNGVVRVDKKPGQDMVYISSNERVLEIFCSGYEPLKIILSEIGIRLKGKDVWIIKISGELKEGILEIYTYPIDSVKIFLYKKEIGKTPYKSHFPTGRHKLTLIKEGYKRTSIEVQIQRYDELKDNRLRKNVSLQKLQDNFIIRCKEGKAKVNLDGEYVGDTPYHSGIVEKKEHKIKLQKELYFPSDEFLITIKEGIVIDTTISLEPNYGTISIYSDPSDAKIEIKGPIIWEGKTPLEKVKFPTGNYIVRLIKDSYEIYEKEQEISSSTKITIDKKLSKMTGHLEIISEPQGALIFLDGNEQKSRTNTILKNIPTGRHKIILDKSGYDIIEEDIFIKYKETTEFNKLLSTIGTQQWGKNRKKARTLALLIPGGGHFFSKRYLKGSIYTGLYIFGILSCNKYLNDYNRSKERYKNANDYYHSSVTQSEIDKYFRDMCSETKKMEYYKSIFNISFTTAVSIYIIQLIDILIWDGRFRKKPASLSNFSARPILLKDNKYLSFEISYRLNRRF